MRLARNLCLGGAAAVVIGLLGASAFNPDSGSITHNETLWRIFGLLFEAGAFLALPIGFCLAIVTLVRSARRARHGDEPDGT